MVVLANGEIDVTVEPGQGAAVLSMRRVGGAEWLAPGRWGDDIDPDEFTTTGLRGYDDCFLSISRATALVDGAPVRVPDHGPTWSRAWEVQARSQTSLTCSIALPEYGCRLRRSDELTGTTLRMAYALVNDRDADLAFVWAGHGLLVPSAGLRFSGGDVRGRWTDIPEGTARKWFAPWPAEGVRVESGAETLLIQADAPSPLWLGVWHNRHGHELVPAVEHLGLEPTLGDDDSLDVARERGTAAVVAGHGSYAWTVSYTLGVAAR